MDTLADRINKAMKVRGVTATDLIARKVLSKAGVYFLIDGTTKADKVRAETIERLAKALGVNQEWLFGGRGPMEGRDDPEEGWPDILAYKQSAAMGHGVVPDDYAETHKLKFRADSLSRKRLNPDRLGVIYGKGDSMMPRIQTGDAILFNRDETTPVDGSLFVVSYDGDLLAKQLSNIGGRWFLESLNRDDPKWRKPIPIDEFKHFEIHGRVRWIGSWED